MANVFERGLALLCLVFLSPLLAVAAIAIVLEDGGPAFFIQSRVGRNQHLFRLWKLRSMRIRRQAGAEVTSSADPRVTRVGRILRKYKLDEIPQLWNVCRGDMSFIGPRPEVPTYVISQDRIWKQILSLRPGLTDLSTLVYRNEEHLLAGAADPDSYYRTILLPQKLQLAWGYSQVRTFLTDLKLLGATFSAILHPAALDPEGLKRQFLNENTHA